MLPTLDRSCSCGPGSATLVFQDQNGNTYAMTGSVVEIPNYGPHPTLNLSTTPGAGASPIVIEQPDGADAYTRTIRWSASQSGRKLLAPDGTTVLFEAPAETPLAVNGAVDGQPTVSGGLRVTPSGTRNHEPSISVALDPDNPPSGFHINSRGYLEDGAS